MSFLCTLPPFDDVRVTRLVLFITVDKTVRVRVRLLLAHR